MAEFDRTVPFTQDVLGTTFPGGFSSQVIEIVLTYKQRDDDLFVVTYPKCGTNWMPQIVYLIYNKGVPGKNRLEVFRCTPFLELCGVECAEQLPRPGSIMSHVPHHLMPYSDKAKYVHVVRNPKDVCVSYFHHMITDPNFTFQEGTIERYFEDFINGRVAYNDYFDHLLGWYEHRNDPNVLFITYEELKKDTRNSVLKVAKFMGDEWFDMLNSNEEILENVLKFSRFDLMKESYSKKPSGEGSESQQEKATVYPGMKHIMEFAKSHRKEDDAEFLLIRKGQVGNWRSVLSEDQIARLDSRIEETLKDTDVYKFWKTEGCL